MDYDWPGNIRELENCIERAVILTNSDTISASDLYFFSHESASPQPTIPESRGLRWAAVLAERYGKGAHQPSSGEACDWHQSRAADTLQIDRKTLRNKIREFWVDGAGAELRRQPIIDLIGISGPLVHEASKEHFRSLMHGQAMSARQVLRAIPEQILASKILKMGLPELQSFVEQQVLENPALVVEESSRCPLCGAPLSGQGSCQICGSSLDCAPPSHIGRRYLRVRQRLLPTMTTTTAWARSRRRPICNLIFTARRPASSRATASL